MKMAIDFVAVLKKIRQKAYSASGPQQLVDYIDGQIDAITTMYNVSEAPNAESRSLPVAPKVDLDKFVDSMGSTGGAVQTQAKKVAINRFHGAEFTSDDL